MSDFISSGVKGFLDYGIDLKLESYEEENYYITQMCEYFNKQSSFKAYLSGDKSFEIELDRDTPIMEVMIRDSILSIVPYTDDIFETFTLILGFIAKKHKDIIKEFRGNDFHKIESVKEISGVDDDKTDEEEEPSDDDDFEWI